MTENRSRFYEAARPIFGGHMMPAQVDTMEALLDDDRGLTNPQLAYVLATALHEAQMRPQRENLVYTSAQRIRDVWPSRFTSAASAKPFVRNAVALANHVYGGRLGNRPGTDDGWLYRGGGLDQLTGRDNYRRLSALVGEDMESHPERILDPEIAVASILHGMTAGTYRPGHKLSDYISGDKVDFAGARAIVNADGARVGADIAAFANRFLSALNAAGRAPGRDKVVPAPPAPAAGFWAGLEAFLAWLTKGRRT
jgi:putative chitinase